MNLKSIYNKAIYFLIPAMCLQCNTAVNSYGLCSDCFSPIKFIRNPKCLGCGHPFPSRSCGKVCGSCLKNPLPLRIISVVEYNDDSRDLILKFKHADASNIAPFMANLMCGEIKEIIDDIDMIIPVPLHYSRLIKRRFNQSGLLAGLISKKFSKPVDLMSIRRIKKTAPQENKSYAARHKNMGDAFAVDDIRKLIGKNILLIDDVLTSGATLISVAKILKRSGVKNVYAVTYARVSKGKKI